MRRWVDTNGDRRRPHAPSLAFSNSVLPRSATFFIHLSAHYHAHRYGKHYPSAEYPARAATEQCSTPLQQKGPTRCFFASGPKNAACMREQRLIRLLSCAQTITICLTASTLFIFPWMMPEKATVWSHLQI